MPSSEVFPKFKRRQLHSGGPNGPIVTNPAQVRAIAASERAKEKANGGVYPEPTRKRKKAAGKMAEKTR